MSVRHTLLGLIASQPRYGYELLTAFTCLVGGSENWDLKPSQLYTTLNRMVDGGLIEPDPLTGERRIYRITPSGETELIRWLHEVDAGTPQQDGFYLKMMLSRQLPGVDTQKLIQSQRGRLYQHLHDLTERRSKIDPRFDLAGILLLDKAIMHIEADLRWLDMFEARLDEIVSQPARKPQVRPRGRPRKKVADAQKEYTD